ncbi:hypothetical protein BH10ACI1_BH10ACI1_03450 [soil metagenome]
MFLRSKFFRVICSLSLLLALFSFVLADTIRLKDGSIIKGKIINFSGGQFTVLIGEGSRQRRMNFYADEVESIEFDSTSMSIATVNTNTQLPTKTNSSTTNSNTSNNNSNTTVITVGQTNTTVPTPSPSPSPTVNNNNDTIIISPTNTSTNTNTNTNTNPVTPKPIQLNVKVLADNTANGWTNSGWVVKKGQKIRITSRGNISLGNGKYATSGGIPSLADKDKLMSQEPTGGLIAVIGDDNNDFIFIGSDREFTASRDGSLFLGINESNLDDNSGSFQVTIEIEP